MIYLYFYSTTRAFLLFLVFYSIFFFMTVQCLTPLGALLPLSELSTNDSQTMKDLRALGVETIPSGLLTQVAKATKLDKHVMVFIHFFSFSGFSIFFLFIISFFFLFFFPIFCIYISHRFPQTQAFTSFQPLPLVH